MSPRRLAAVLIGLAVTGGAGAARAEPPERAFLRPYLNGAGPSAVFRMGRLATTGQDVIGIVDPVRWRIQYYLLEPWSAGGRPIADRLRPVGDCALAPTFRVWRVHHHVRRVVLQSQPEVSSRILSPAPLVHRRLVLRTDQRTLQAISRRQPTADEALPQVACATAGVDGGRERFIAADAGATVTGGGNRPFVVRRRGVQPSRFLARAVRPGPLGPFTSSVQELEESRAGAAVLRHFQVSVRGGAPGFVGGELAVVRRSANGSQDARMRIDPAMIRIKMAQRALAVTSAGEVLVLGASDRSGVYLTSCRFAPGAREQTCRLEPRPGLAGAAPAVPTPRQEAAPRPSRSELWSRALWYSTQPYEVDAEAIPSRCRGLRPCDLGGGLLWSPLTELRFAQGRVRRAGAPYAQSQSDAFRPHWARAAPNPRPSPAFRNGGPMRVFGDIENGRAAWAPEQVQIVGIDCSALVSYLWGRRTSLGTAEFVSLAHRGRYARVENMAQVRMGDAFLINLIDAADRDQPLMLNHIALFRETRPAGPADTSRAILVLEANAACGGVCWTLYDESFFTGWAMIRNQAAPPRAPGFEPIPTDIGAWRRRFSA